MDSEAVSRSRDDVWVKVLRSYPLSAEERPSMAPLLRAAREEPVLRAMYPWISVQQLSFSLSDDWEDWGHAPLPALFARPDAYWVVDSPASGSRVELETTDPAEAVAFFARRLEERQVGPSPEVGGWCAEVEETLDAAGWYPGRVVDTAGWRERLEAEGFRMHPAAEKFLREFGGLAVGYGGPGITRAREPFEFDPLLALGEDDRFGEWGEIIGRCLFPLGELDHGRSFLGLDEQGELYVVDSGLARFGRMPDAMVNLALGVMPVRMPDPAQP
ncbi:SUKH-3 domain-containing protein [Streptomyces yangpuensis]|uniref:SUKH-3 domain-containing protein n=1 Tax=Streptomyces yangpuensis TaxID=1648182 RepID=UPI0022866065|nr:SUKH-3 domain-containing protein [Streptomyces yangpuensis]